MKSLYILIIIFIVIVSLFLCKKTKEPYVKLFGTLSPYTKDYGDCINYCEKGDPKFTNTTECAEMCNNKIYELSEGERVITSKSNLEYCEDSCENVSTVDTTPGQKKDCVRRCNSQREAIEWCLRRECPYSDDKECIGKCLSKTIVNSGTDGEWIFKF